MNGRIGVRVAKAVWDGLFERLTAHSVDRNVRVPYPARRIEGVRQTVVGAAAALAARRVVTPYGVRSAGDRRSPATGHRPPFGAVSTAICSLRLTMSDILREPPYGQNAVRMAVVAVMEPLFRPTRQRMAP